MQAVSKWNALLRKEYSIDPDSLSDMEWAKLVGELKYLRQLEDDRFQNNLKIVLYELATKLYGKD